jgi:hypothetical protein
MVYKSGTVSAKLSTLQCTFCVQDTKYKQKSKVLYKNFLHEVRRSWISEVQNRSESNSDLQLPEKQTTPWRQADFPGISVYKNLKKCLLVESETSVLQDSVKCVLHIRSKVKLETFVNSALFHFTMDLF